MGWGNNTHRVEGDNKVTPLRLRKSPRPAQCLLFNLNPCSWCSITPRCKLLRHKLFGAVRSGAVVPGASLGSLAPDTVVGWGTSSMAVPDLHTATGSFRVYLLKHRFVGVSVLCSTRT